MKVNPVQSPFRILGVTEDATDEQVRQAYRRKGMKHHPDRNPSKEAEAEFKRIRTAYELLKDEESRKKVIGFMRMYNRHTHAQPNYGERGGDPYVAAAAQAYYESKIWDSFLYIPGLMSLSRMFLGFVSVFHIERVPFKMLFFFPYTLSLNYLYSSGQLTPAIMVGAFGQALLGAVLTELLLDVSAWTDRYKLRRSVNRVLVMTMVLVGAVIVVTFFAPFFRLDTEAFDANVSFIYAVCLILFVLSVYFWFVFCFLFQRRHPTWESVLVWIGVGGALFYFFFVLLR